VLVKQFGIAGAAAAWTLKSLLDALLTFGAVFWLNSVSFRSLLQNGIRRTLLAISALGVSLAIVWRLDEPFQVQVPVAAILLLAFALLSWTHVLDSTDRNLLVGTASQVRLAFARGK
jgi:hypothetical protein